jgi:GntR family transcriptional regulator, transcriptional repressor for pyruvate dehydrogenase complex
VQTARRHDFAVEPIRATRTFEAAIEHLTEAIERSELRRGDRLPGEHELAGMLEISRPTLRQAVRVLELSGVLEARRGKHGGIFLASELIPTVAVSSAVALEEDSAVEVLRARRVLETAVAHEAAVQARAEDCRRLERAIELLGTHVGERPLVMRADALFHRAVVRACHNRALDAAMRSVAKSLAPIRDAYSGGIERDRRTLDVHARQLDAMRRRDLPALDIVLDEHFRMLEETFAEAIGRRWDELFGAG